MSDRELIARAIYDYVDDEGIDWGDLDEGERDQARGIAEAVLAALGATGDDVLVALPRGTVVEWAAGEQDEVTRRLTGTACRAALARGRREPVTVTLDPDVAEAVRRLIGGGSRRDDDQMLDAAIAALDAALGGES